MDNYKLLEKHRKKLSIYFSIFILISILLVVLFFDISKYISSEKKEQKLLINKTKQLENIIRNSDKYIELNEITFKKILKKIIQNTLIATNWNIIVNEINNNISIDKFKTNNYIKEKWYLYYTSNYKTKKNNYKIIVREEMHYSIDDLINDYLYFILFSLPFSIFFYFLWYFFVWKNLKPIKQTIKNLEDFTWNINHEFKTPITEIISTLELAKKTKDYKKAINQSINSAQKLNIILNSMLWIISITNVSYNKQKINIINYIKEIIKNYKQDLSFKNIKIILKTNLKTNIKKINKNHLYICISNLISNSIKYSKNNSKINIIIWKDYIKIQDFWVWIENKYLKEIFNRHFRENYIKENWMWIGLSITKKICDLNSWKLNIKSKKNKWTLVKITFS